MQNYNIVKVAIQTDFNMKLYKKLFMVVKGSNFGRTKRHFFSLPLNKKPHRNIISRKPKCGPPGWLRSPGQVRARARSSVNFSHTFEVDDAKRVMYVRCRSHTPFVFVRAPVRTTIVHSSVHRCCRTTPRNSKGVTLGTYPSVSYHYTRVHYLFFSLLVTDYHCHEVVVTIVYVYFYNEPRAAILA